MLRVVLGRGVVILLFALLCLEADAQDTSAITGTVVDPTGAAINGVRITVIEDSTGRMHETATDCRGIYGAGNLPPGSYSVRFVKKYFRVETRSAVLVSPSRVTQVDSKLQLATEVSSGPQVPDPEVTVENGPTGTIRGTATGPTGTAVPTRIWAFEQSKEKSYTFTTTDSDGNYQLKDLPPGSYCLGYEAGDTGSGSRNAVVVTASHTTAEDIHLAARTEKVEVCTASCPVEIIEASPPGPGNPLHLYAENNVATASSPLWLTVTLTNKTEHPISLHEAGDPNMVLGCQIYAWGPCNCPGKLRELENGAGAPEAKRLAHLGDGAGAIRMPRGGTLTDRIDLSKLMDLLPGSTYIVQVWRRDTSTAKNGQHAKDPPLIKSNTILISVMAPR